MHRRFVSVKVKQAAAMGAFIAVVSLLLAVFLPNRLDAVARRWAERGAEGIALVLAKAVSAAVSFSEVQDTTADMIQDLSNLASADGARYAVIEHRNGSVLATWVHEKVGTAKRFEAARQALGEAPTQYAEGYLFVRTPILAYDPGAKRDVQLATLTIGFSMDALSQQRRDNLTVVIVLTAVLLVVGLFLAFVMGGIIVRPILALARATETITDSGDLTQRVAGTSADEIGALSQQFNEMIEQLYSMFTAVKRSVDGLGGAIKLINGAGNRVARGAESIDMRLQDTSACVEEMLASISSTAENVESLEQGAKEGSSVILSIAKGNDRVAEDVQTMATAASSATTDVEQIGTFVQDAAQRISDLTQIIDETAGEMEAIRAAVDKVEKESGETSRLAEAVSQDAARGQEALERTLGGISRIQQSSQIVADSIGVLARYTENIDEILTVIGGVTEQTTLLALNAAIIAARAGENGRGFSIVADEIRSLAERTRRQTDEIAKLIHNLQTEAKKAARSIEEGVSDVREGVELGRAAKQSLDEILASAESASVRVRHIAEATAAQGGSTRRVADALAKVNRMVQSINNATEEQAKRTAQIIDSMTTMNGLAQQVREASREQAAGSKRITAAMERILRMVGEVRKAQHEQRFASGEVLKAVDAIRQTAGEQREAASHLETVIQTLSRQDDELQRELRRFRAQAPPSSGASPGPRQGTVVPLRAGQGSPARALPT